MSPHCKLESLILFDRFMTKACLQFKSILFYVILFDCHFERSYLVHKYRET